MEGERFFVESGTSGEAEMLGTEIRRNYLCIQGLAPSLLPPKGHHYLQNFIAHTITCDGHSRSKEVAELSGQNVSTSEGPGPSSAKEEAGASHSSSP